MSANSLEARIKARARELGFDDAGIARLGPSDHAAFYRAWLAAGRHGEMEYLARPDAVERRLEPTRRHPELRSAVVVCQHYFPGDEADSGAPGPAPAGADPAHGPDPSRGIIARYARGRDYHKIIKRKLLELLHWLEAELGRELPAARASVDTGPVLERELARRAGLGWFGRNAMLIQPRGGSYFFIGTLLLELDLELDAPFEADRCGSCHACLDACPTGALLGRDASGAPVIDARRCISYLTIELRGPIPRELRPLMGNRVFGCDICQECCPWNGDKFVQLTKETEYRPRGTRLMERTGSVRIRERPDSDSAASPLDPTCADLPSAAVTSGGRCPPSVADSESGRTSSGSRAAASIPGTSGPWLLDLMAMDDAAWDEFSRRSAIRRAGRAGFLRNVAVALGNWGAPEAVPALIRALEDPEPLVRGHAAWALGRIGTAEARAALRARRELEPDGWVREELT